MEKISNKEELKAEVIEEKKTEEIKDENVKEKKEKNLVVKPDSKEKKADKKEEKDDKNDKEKNTKFQQSSESFYKKKSKKWIFIITALITILVMLSVVFALVNIGNEKIIDGITIDGIAMKGLTKEEAKTTLNNKIEEKLNKGLKVKVDNDEQELFLSQFEIEYDVDSAVETAYKIGREGNILVNNFDIVKCKLFGNDLKLNVSYNEEKIGNSINEVKSKISNAVQEVDYSIEEDELIITRGTAGYTINEEELKQKIIECMNLSKENVITINSFYSEPKDINIEKIYEAVHTEAKDAYYTKNPFQIFPEVLGIDFNIDEAKEELKETKDEYIIKLTITKPSKTVNDIGTEAFPDQLSTFTTRYDASNVPRTTNLKLAVDKINGTVVMPGETFSYNKTVGKRTAAAGFKEAAGYQGGKVVQMTGGGICQISSTLYDAVVYANLEVVERHNHAFTTSYIGAGKDATVVYGSLDFKFKNNRNYPISISASAQNGIAKIEIYGIKEENEYDVEISTTILSYIPYRVIYEDDSSLAEGVEKVTQHGGQGCKSITYKILKKNGVEVSRSVLSNDTYDAMNKYISRGTKKTVQQVTEPETPTEPSVPEPQPEEPITTPQPEEPIATPQPEEPVQEEP